MPALFHLWPQVSGSFPHIKQSFDTSWVSYNSAQFWHCLPGDSGGSHRLRAQPHKTAPCPNVRRQSQVQVVACASDQPAVNWKVPGPPPLGSINLLEQLTEIRKTVYLLDYCFIVEDITQEQPDGRDAWDTVQGKSAVYMLCGYHFPHISICSPPWNLYEPHPSGFYRGFIT